MKGIDNMDCDIGGFVISSHRIVLMLTVLVVLLSLLLLMFVVVLVLLTHYYMKYHKMRVSESNRESRSKRVQWVEC